ncbi:MAG TPA: alpha/beta fold hydrolase [Thermoanaerobaculia bacterium]|nr:alpha/beta fold hydrolase [Thermoanaerobaculia bacterium]
MRCERCVLIQGFAGSPASWDAVVERLPEDWRVLRPTLAGHDPRAGWPQDVRGFEDEVDRLAHEIGPGPPSLLCGYSLGGRLALGLLARHPGRFAAALVIGAHPGLPGPHPGPPGPHPGPPAPHHGPGQQPGLPGDELATRVPTGAAAGDEGRRSREPCSRAGSPARAERCAADERWAAVIERDLDAFVEEWQALPLFASQRRLPAEALEAQDRIRRGHRPETLARAMRVLSLGAMPDHREALGRVRVPVVLMTGELDRRFTGLAVELAASIPGSRVEVVPGVGHNVPLEAPGAVAAGLRELAARRS